MLFRSLLGMALSALLGWSLMTGIVFGLCLSTASTVVPRDGLLVRRTCCQRYRLPDVQQCGDCTLK